METETPSNPPEEAAGQFAVELVEQLHAVIEARFPEPPQDDAARVELLLAIESFVAGTLYGLANEDKSGALTLLHRVVLPTVSQMLLDADQEPEPETPET